MGSTVLMTHVLAELLPFLLLLGEVVTAAGEKRVSSSVPCLVEEAAVQRAEGPSFQLCRRDLFHRFPHLRSPSSQGL